MLSGAVVLFFLLVVLDQVGADNTAGVNLRYQRGLEFACMGMFEEAQQKFSAVLDHSPDHVAALHNLATMELIIAKDLTRVGTLHKKAVAISKETPPLAKMFQDKVPCNNLGKAYFSASMTKKKMADKPSMDMFSSHKNIGTLLEIAGLNEAAAVHYSAALKLRPDDVALEMHSIFLMPIVYSSEQEIQSARTQLVEQIQSAIEIGDTKMLDKINKFSLPQVFYLVYQGRNDKAIMEAVAQLYEARAPKLSYVHPAAAAALGAETAAAEAQKVREGAAEGGAEADGTVERDQANAPGERLRKVQLDALLKQQQGGDAATEKSADRLRVGVFTHHLRSHSVCRFMCGLWKHLDKSLFDVVLITDLPESEHDEMTRWAANMEEGEEGEQQVAEGGLPQLVVLDKKDGLEKAREKIGNLGGGRGLDVLVYGDIGMDLSTYKFAMGRLAPVQINYMGHPTSRCVSVV
jgi:predicted O-linked N-acetylglucosamine transferase (SPINDLY family)